MLGLSGSHEHMEPIEILKIEFAIWDSSKKKHEVRFKLPIAKKCDFVNINDLFFLLRHQILQEISPGYVYTPGNDVKFFVTLIVPPCWRLNSTSKRAPISLPLNQVPTQPINYMPRVNTDPSTTT